jgi:hypothetical protein
MNPSDPQANPPYEQTPEAATPEISTAPETGPLSEAVSTVEAPVAAAPKVVGYCRDCGQALYEGSAVHQELGAIYCGAHRPAHLSGQIPPPSASWTASPGAANFAPSVPHTVSPYASLNANAGNANAGQSWPSSSPPGASPGLAFLLGLIPGVGAVYNGQYAKGLIHVVIFGLMISVANTERGSEFGPLFGLVIACFYFYMPFEAYHTAKLRRAGVPVDEFSGVMSRRGPSSAPVGPIMLIVIGVLFLLSNLEIIEFRRLIRFWPALLIVLGFYMLYKRLAGSRVDSVENKRDGQ